MAEDHQLRKLVADYGDDNWAKIASFMHDRTPRQCRERYLTYLSPTVNLSPWTQEEDNLLRRLFTELGSKWTSYGPYFQHRTVSNIKNRWHTLSRRKGHRESTTDLEPEPVPPEPTDVLRVYSIENLLNPVPRTTKPVVA